MIPCYLPFEADVTKCKILSKETAVVFGVLAVLSFLIWLFSLLINLLEIDNVEEDIVLINIDYNKKKRNIKLRKLMGNPFNAKWEGLKFVDANGGSWWSNLIVAMQWWRILLTIDCDDIILGDSDSESLDLLKWQVHIGRRDGNSYRSFNIY